MAHAHAKNATGNIVKGSTLVNLEKSEEDRDKR